MQTESLSFQGGQGGHIEFDWLPKGQGSRRSDSPTFRGSTSARSGVLLPHLCKVTWKFGGLIDLVEGLT